MGGKPFWIAFGIAIVALIVLFISIYYISHVASVHIATGETQCMSVGDISGFFGTISNILAVIITVLAFIVAIIPIAQYFTFANAVKVEVEERVEGLEEKLRKELKEGLEHEVGNQKETLEGKLKHMIEEKAVQQFKESLEKQAAEQDRLRYLTEIILSNLWGKRVTRIEKATTEQKLDTFIDEQTLYLKDTFTFTQLRSPEPKDVFTALATLEHREDLPREIVKLICLLEKQGRLRDEFARQAAEAVLHRFGKELRDC